MTLTFEQQRRWQELTFECLDEAQQYCFKHHPTDPKRGEPSIRGRRIGQKAAQLRIERAKAEGLPRAIWDNPDDVAARHASDAVLAAHDAAQTDMDRAIDSYRALVGEAA